MTTTTITNYYYYYYYRIWISTFINDLGRSTNPILAIHEPSWAGLVSLH